jgi:hypothetical protein
VLVAELVRRAGHDVTTARDAAQIGRSDTEQLAHAVSEGRALATHNRKHYVALFEEYLRTGRPRHGIIILIRRPRHEVAGLLLSLLDRLTADELSNQLLYL